MRLTATQRQMLEDIETTGKADGGRGWTSHSQRCLDSLVRRSLVAYGGNGRWKLTDQAAKSEAQA